LHFDGYITEFDKVHPITYHETQIGSWGTSLLFL